MFYLQRINERTLLSLLLFFSMTAAGWNQEQHDAVQRSLAMQVISKIDAYEQAEGRAETEKAKLELLRLQSTIKKHEDLANVELEHAVSLYKLSEHRLSSTTAELEKLNAEAQIKFGMLVPNDETIEFLLRNCLLEQQRLSLESITERKLLETKKNPQEDFEAERLRIEAEEVALNGLQAQLQAAKKKYETAQINEQTFKELETDVAVRSTKLRAMMAEFQHKKSLVKSSSEERLLEFRMREEALKAQLERLGIQQQFARKAKHLNHASDFTNQQIQKTLEQVSRCETKKHELAALQKMIEKALQHKQKDPE